MSPSPNTTPEKKALLEAFDTVLKVQAEEREARLAEAAARRRHGASRLLMVVSTTLLLFTGIYLYVERPAWVFPAPPTPESLAVREASLRIGVANAAQHVERYRQHTGRLPATLVEAGAHDDGLTYVRRGSGYQILGEQGDVSVAYDSDDSLTRFVGNSFKVIARRSR